MKRHALLVFDEGPGAGLGHRRRMEVLALELHSRGWSCRLAALDNARTLAAAVVVVDSYRVDAAHDGVDAQLLVAVDDLQRDLAVDVVIDPSPGADPSRHKRAQTVLAGALYSLVGAPQPTAAVVRAGAVVTRVLVTTGAADVEGAGAGIATALRAALPDAIEVRLVVGRWGAPDVPAGVIAVHAPASLADELAAAPIVVTAGGVSMLESCLLGRATVAVVLAENQRIAAEALAAAGAVLRVEVAGIAGTVLGLVHDEPAREALGAAGGIAIDGQGAARVAEALSRLAVVA